MIPVLMPGNGENEAAIEIQLGDVLRHRVSRLTRATNLIFLHNIISVVEVEGLDPIGSAPEGPAQGIPPDGDVMTIDHNASELMAMIVRGLRSCWCYVNFASKIATQVIRILRAVSRGVLIERVSLVGDRVLLIGSVFLLPIAQFVIFVREDIRHLSHVSNVLVDLPLPT